MTQQNHHDNCEMVCSISLQKQDGPFEEEEANALMHDWIFFLEPYLTKFLVRPHISRKNNTIFTASFTCYPQLRETIESFLYITMKYDHYYKTTSTFDPIERSLDKV
ncbi:hypothetical protein Syn8016DRAFT_0831 [Synechococcus sp. WH 8016]|nr:hypothetical protein Syn8016DRAFT_0831 [Synechococcus sp. WH 8016]